MSLFIPTLYAGRVLTQLRARLVGRSLTNANYTGEITRVGDTVRVYAVGDIAVKDHERGERIAFQNPAGSEVVMQITEEKDASFLIDDVDAFQSRIDVQNAYAAKAVQALEEAADSFILSKVADADAANVISTTATTANGFMTVVRNAKVALSEQNVPREGRYLVVSPFYANLISEYISTTMQDGQVARAGWLGRVEGFDIYESNRLPEDEEGEKLHMLFGHPEAITYADQIVKASFVPELDEFHAGAFKGLHVYGAKVFVPKALGRIEADIPS